MLPVAENNNGRKLLKNKNRYSSEEKVPCESQSWSRKEVHDGICGTGGF